MVSRMESTGPLRAVRSWDEIAQHLHTMRVIEREAIGEFLDELLGEACLAFEAAPRDIAGVTSHRFTDEESPAFRIDAIGRDQEVA